MLILKPIRFDYKISTTDLELVYTESGGVKVGVGAKPLKNVDSKKYANIEISFSIVAEVKCTTLNFYEFNYNGFSFSEESGDENKYSGFYEVVNSNYLQEKVRIYDPRDRNNLKHYIITGYDGYVELIASTYEIKKLPPVIMSTS